MDRIFMDGGSSLNIIFTSTLHKMLIPRSVWKKSSTVIHGVVPGEATSSLGVIELDVVFGSKRNFARQALEFEVLDWQSQYHAILGRQAFAQFMTVPHYASSNSRCQDPQESSQSTEASPNRTSAIAISTKSPTRLEPSNSSKT